jgi:hypothetical protein
MFEPENDIERLLMRASAEPAERPGFARALMDAQIFVVLVPDRPIVPGPDGKVTIPQGAKLALPNAMRGEERLIPFFTSPSRASIWFSGDHIAAPDRTRDLFERYPDAPFLLNPGSDYGKEFTPAEVKRLLAGEFDDRPRTIVTEKSEQVLLGHPREIPVALIAALARELGAVKTVQGAWADACDAAGQHRTKLDARHRSHGCVAGRSGRDRPRAHGRHSRGENTRRRAARGQFARPHTTYRNSRHRRLSAASSGHFRQKSHGQTQSSHFRRALPRSRANL